MDAGKEHPYKYYYPPHGKYYCTKNPDGTGSRCNCSCPECGFSKVSCKVGNGDVMYFNNNQKQGCILLPKEGPNKALHHRQRHGSMQPEMCTIDDIEWEQSSPTNNNIQEPNRVLQLRGGATPCILGCLPRVTYSEREQLQRHQATLDTVHPGHRHASTTVNSDHVEQICQWMDNLHSGSSCYFGLKATQCVDAGGTGAAGNSPKGTVTQTNNGVYTCQIQCDPGTYPTGTARKGVANAPLVPRGTRARAAPVLPKHAHPANTARAVRIPPSRVRRATTAPPRTTNSMPRRVQVYWRWRKGNPVL